MESTGLQKPEMAAFHLARKAGLGAGRASGTLAILYVSGQAGSCPNQPRIRAAASGKAFQWRGESPTPEPHGNTPLGFRRGSAARHCPAASPAPADSRGLARDGLRRGPRPAAAPAPPEGELPRARIGARFLARAGQRRRRNMLERPLPHDRAELHALPQASRTPGPARSTSGRRFQRRYLAWADCAGPIRTRARQPRSSASFAYDQLRPYFLEGPKLSQWLARSGSIGKAGDPV